MKKRTISAIIMLAIVIPLIAIGGWFYSLGIGIVCSLAYKELTEIRKETKDDYPSLMKLVGLISTIMIVYSTFDSNGLIFGLDYNILGAAIIFLMVPTVFYNNEKYSIEDAFYLLGNVLFLGISFNLFIGVRTSNLSYFILLILITTLTDTFAYIGGMLIGKHTFTSISPKKTIEGSIGGTVGCVAVAYIYGVIVSKLGYFPKFSNLLIFAAVSSVVSQFGDLAASCIKREHGVKDYGSLIPGHGGILDRFDSVLFVAPLMYYFMQYLPIL